MISDIFINLFYQIGNFIVFLLSGFGSVTLSQNIPDAILTVSGYYAAINELLPIDTILAIIIIDIAVEVSIFTYKLVKWAYQKIPGIT